MHALRQTQTVARFMLVWFALSLGVAMASPWVAPKGLDLICTTGGAMKLVSSDGADPEGLNAQAMDCALCVAVALPPAPANLAVTQISALSHALHPIAAAHIASATAPPLPSRGPPAL